MSSWTYQCNLVGRLSYERTIDPTTGAVQTLDSFSYDALGRVWLKWQGPYSTLFGYDLAGRTVQSRRGTYAAGVAPQLFLGDYLFTYDGAGHIQSIAESTDPSDSPSTQTLLFTANQYGPMGLTQATLGNGTVLTNAYNNRGWKNSIKYTLSTGTLPAYKLDLTFYHNGNVQAATDSINGNWLYTYDSLNRLHTAASSTQAFQYDFDPFGNRLDQIVTSGAGPQNSYTYPTNNQIAASAGVTYDSGSGSGAGYVTGDGFHSYSYDAEGRLASVDGSISYIYNAEGQRTAVLSGGSVVRQYLYDNVGHPATVLDGSGNLIRAELWADNMHLGDYIPDGANNYTNNYIFSDHLGNLRAVYDNGENQLETRQSLPFGEDQNATGTDVDPLHFTGKERDSESGLDYFGARYYGSTMGRFMSPDPSGLVYADITNPQSLNLYSYARNNPLVNIDPTGMECVWDDGSYDSNDDPDTGSSGQCSAARGNWVDHSYFQTTGKADWSSKPNSNLTCGGISPPTAPISYSASAQANSQMGTLGWYQAFKGGGTQDFKGNVAFGSPANQAAAGNFNFGASVAAKGWSLTTGQFLAGAGAMISSAANQLNAAAQGVGSGAGQAQGALLPVTPIPPIPASTMGPGFPGFPTMAPNGIMTQGDQASPSENQSVVSGYLWQSLGCTQ